MITSNHVLILLSLVGILYAFDKFQKQFGDPYQEDYNVSIGGIIIVALGLLNIIIGFIKLLSK